MQRSVFLRWLFRRLNKPKHNRHVMPIAPLTSAWIIEHKRAMIGKDLEQDEQIILAIPQVDISERVTLKLPIVDPDALTVAEKASGFRAIDTMVDKHATRLLPAVK